MNERILEYIRQYRGIYTREAITRQLINNGFTAEQVEEAWKTVEAASGPTAGLPEYNPPSYAPPPPGSGPANFQGFPPGANYGRPYQPRPRLRNNSQFWLALIGVIFGLPIVAGVLSYFAGSYTAYPSALVTIGVLVAGIYYSNKNYALSRGLLYGLLVVVVLPMVLGFIAIVIIFGICLVGGYRI